jgi:hypothetical protein
VTFTIISAAQTYNFAKVIFACFSELIFVDVILTA